ncbi:MAG: hypothetical protein NT062_24195, partial [Proteobacteria bacterium]|nr:hypothetical protein [Pseudomonadota bacterium]
MRSLVVVVATLAPLTAQAEDAIVSGTIVKIEAQEVYVSFGVLAGVTTGSAIRIKHPITLRHPVTKAVVNDWIPVGTAQVTQAGTAMSRAVIGELVAAVKVGDVVEVIVHRDTPSPARPTTPQPTPSTPTTPPTPAPPIDPETAEVLQVFARQAAQPLDVRISGWEHYLSTHANGPFAPDIRGELDALRTLRDELAPPTMSQEREGGNPLTVEHEALKTAERGMPMPVVFVLAADAGIASAYLHYRTRGSPTYRSVLLAREHDLYLRGTIPAEVVVAPGVDYFVEVSTTAGASSVAIGSPREPIT